MHSHSFQDIELKFHRYVNDSTVHVADWFTILPYPGWVRNRGLITQKTLHSHSFQDTELKLHSYVNNFR